MKINYPSKQYLHFDKKINFNKKVEKYVLDFEKNPSHAFLPLIYTELSFETFNRLALKKVKKRPIMYAGHMDNFIFKHYSNEIDELYKKYVTLENFNNVATAYRNDTNGKNNIHFAAEVIDFINRNPNCYIHIGDYTDFFGSLDHSYLKNMLQRLYNNKIPLHQFKIFKNLTKYAYIDIDQINNYLGTDYYLLKCKKNSYFDNFIEFRKFKNSKSTLPNDNEKILKKNINSFGIPQGTAISAIYSNVYMLDVDKKISFLIDSYGGLYRRYSDDFIIVIPNITPEIFNTIKKNISSIINTSHLKLHEKKTQNYQFKQNNIINLSNNQLDKIDYLGFCFDGSSVKIREKSIYKYYRTAYKLIEKGEIISKKKGHTRLTYKRKLYQSYHIFGEYTDNKYSYKKREYGSFITYVYKSQKIFDRLSPNTNNFMENQIKNHKKKIAKKINSSRKRLNPN